MGLDSVDQRPASGSDSDPDIALRVEHISKAFPGTRALQDVGLEVRRGEVHALVGINGSGKSTLVKILAGVYTADPGGEIAVGGKRFPAHRLTAADARSCGLHFVHQAPALFPALTVAENLAIGRGFETYPYGRVNWTDQRQRARRLIERFHIRAEPDMPLALLGAADRTLVAVARALQDQESEREGVLVFDEPTASLPGPEVERLLDTLRGYAAAGRAIVYVTHRLDEVLRMSHRVTALRDGRVVGTVDTSTMDETKLVSFMLGRAVETSPANTEMATASKGFLSIHALAGRGVASVSFDVARGEVVGIAGLVGSGASEVLRMLFGAEPISSGDVTLDGQPYRPASPRSAMAAGVAYVPSDRAAEAGFHAMNLRANLSAAGVGRYFRAMRMRHRVERADAVAAIARFFIQAASDEQIFSTLSGGNQQKAVLARWLRDQPKLLLLDEPTQGVDVRARAQIHEAVRIAARNETATLVTGSDFQELAGLCDRVLVMVQGRLAGEMRSPAIDAHRLTELAHFAPEAPS